VWFNNSKARRRCCWIAWPTRGRARRAESGAGEYRGAGRCGERGGGGAEGTTRPDCRHRKAAERAKGRAGARADRRLHEVEEALLLRDRRERERRAALERRLASRIAERHVRREKLASQRQPALQTALASPHVLRAGRRLPLAERAETLRGASVEAARKALEELRPSSSVSQHKLLGLLVRRTTATSQKQIFDDSRAIAWVGVVQFAALALPRPAAFEFERQAPAEKRADSDDDRQHADRRH